MRLLAVTLAACLSSAFSGECDLAKIEKGFYCNDCLEPRSAADLVSGVVYYTCDGCGVLSKTEGSCDDCDKPLSKKTSDKGVCAECFEKPEAVELCVKTYFECSGCDAQSTTAQSCKDCGTDFESRVSKAVVDYGCAECGDSARKPGKCTDPDCSRNGKSLTKQCSESGGFPHGGEPN